LVVEASMKSGSLTTSRLVGDQNRGLLTIPDSINSLLSKGYHALIRNGAKLVETVEDIIAGLNDNIDLSDSLLPSEVDQISSANSQDPEHKKVLDSKGYDPVSIDSLIDRSGFRVRVVSSILLILELNGQAIHNVNSMY